MNDHHRTRRARIAATAFLLALGACGGGGSDPSTPSPPPPPPAAGFSVGGTLTIGANLVLDSDTNDPNQQGRSGNGEFASAQQITATSQVMGTVNVAGSGPAGATSTAGDDIDDFRVTLAAGQTIELDFTADPLVNDLDLYIYKRVGTTWKPVGESIGTSPSECVLISEPGEYIVEVTAFSGASLYNLRATAAGAGNCSNATGPAAPTLVPGELIVALPADASPARALAAGLGLQAVRGALEPGRLALVSLPDAPQKRALAAARPELSDDDQRRLQTLHAAKTLRASGNFAQVMLNRVLRTQALVGTFPPNDPRYPLQRWHYEQISLPAAMQALTALSPQPTQRPIVAVIDTGIVADHPDLAPQVVAGFDFVRDTAAAGDGNGIDANPDDLRSSASRPSFHGTHVAGTIAASTFDGVGAAGVAPMAQLMPLRALGEGGSGSFYDIVQAIRYAAGLSNDSARVPARRADVINMSLGADGVACDADSAALFAQVRAQGSIVVVATGNAANRPAGITKPVGYPANCAGVIAVSATDPQRGIAPYSNTGSAVALAAPGGDMRVSTTGTGLPDGVYSTLATFDAGDNRVPTFGVLQGTSMATPHVAGVMALMRWVHPAITPDEIVTLMAQGKLSDDAGTPGRDANYGWGIVNAAKAVQAALELRGGAQPPPGSVQVLPSTLDFGPVATALDFTLQAVGTTSEQVTAVTASSTAVTAAPQSVDAAGLGSYRVTVDRAALAAGVSTPTITVRTSARTLTVQLSIEKRGSAGVPGGDAGPVYVLIFDAATNDIIRQVDVQASGGRYTWNATGITAAAINVIAGTDYDNDAVICTRGEACGAFPVLGTQVTPVMLTGNRSDLDFVIAPVGAGNAGAAAVGLLSSKSGSATLLDPRGGAGWAQPGPGGAQKRYPTPTPISHGSTLIVPRFVPLL